MSDDYTKFIFPIVRREIKPDLYAGEQCCYEPGICMRLGCGLPRWIRPEEGESVLCQAHTEEVLRGETRAPPLIPTFVPPLPESLRLPSAAVFYLDYTKEFREPNEPDKP